MVKGTLLPHAIMLCGPMGCGKMALVMGFASYLLGDRDNNSSDDTHTVSTAANAVAMLKNWEHPDLHFIISCDTSERNFN